MIVVIFQSVFLFKNALLLISIHQNDLKILILKKKFQKHFKIQKQTNSSVYRKRKNYFYFTSKVMHQTAIHPFWSKILLITGKFKAFSPCYHTKQNSEPLHQHGYGYASLRNPPVHAPFHKTPCAYNNLFQTQY